MNLQSPWRWPGRRVFIMVLCLTLLTALTACGGSSATTLIGTDLGEQAAPDFTLIDQRGKTVSLSDFRDKAVVLTFIYTRCPDICPLIARNLGLAYDDLPDETREDVVLVAVTVDPAHDNAAALQSFSERHGLGQNPNWFALSGDQNTLARVWRDYGIDPGTMMNRSAHTPMIDHHGESSGSGNMLAHTDAIYLIDAEGHQRVLMRSSADLDALTANLEALAP